jgi:hypothetical protein
MKSIIIKFIFCLAIFIATDHGAVAGIKISGEAFKGSVPLVSSSDIAQILIDSMDTGMVFHRIEIFSK